MRLSSRLLRSRHGMHYLRVVIPKVLRSAFDGRREFRYSLRTKDASEARTIARVFNMQIDMAFYSLRGVAMAGVLKVKLSDVSQKLADDLKTYTVSKQAGGSMEIKTDGTAEDHHRAMEFFANMSAANIAPIKPSASVVTSPQALRQEKIAGLHLESVWDTLDAFEVNKGKPLSTKTLYEYRMAQERFADWADSHTGRKNCPIALIDTHIIAKYVEYLQLEHMLDPRTIDSKHMSALAALFKQATKRGAYPSTENPTLGHRVMNDNLLNARTDKSKRNKPFKTEELKMIFAHANITTRRKPHEFWLPLIGLFTGARLNEICQLSITDIRSIAGVWAFDINDDDYKTLKNTSSVRIIPIPKARAVSMASQ